MSRHKLIRNMDLDEELDDFDGDDFDDGGEVLGAEELSKEDQENMRVGTVAVRAELPDATRITDAQIQDSLWNYYYDIEQSVGYLRKTYLAKPKGPKQESIKKLTTNEGAWLSFQETGEAWDFPREYPGEPWTTKEYSQIDTFVDFFKDTPWLGVPAHRQAVFVAPVMPRGGLMGGSSDGAPKMSKLQALAAARKKKTLETASNASMSVDKPMSTLSLSDSASKSKAETLNRENASASPSSARGFPLRKRKDSNPHERAPALKVARDSSNVDDIVPMMDEPIIQAEPSAFANAMFSNSFQTLPHQHSNTLFSLPYDMAATAADHDPFSGPSPDDVVVAAQSKASAKIGKSAPKTNGEKRADQIANSVETMKLDDTPRARSKNLDVLSEFRKAKRKNAANFVVIGHVDAGKSTLMGRLLYDLGEVDERTMDRYRKESEKLGKSSFALAWVLDQGTEERNRGVTIDIATNKFETEETVFTILDAPGHRDFIPNMIAGAAQADFAVLVIDASTGSFEAGLKGQTKEHALLARSMGIQRIIIAINKLDSVDWSEERFTEIQNQVLGFMTAASFQAKNLSFIPCSGLLGDNISKRSTAAAASWYQGRTLVEELDSSEPVARALEKPLRLTIADVFRGGVQNPLSVDGRLEAGSLQVGDALLAQPSGEKCFVQGLEVDRESTDWAVAGQNITIHLSGIEEQHLKVGDVLCSPSSPIKNVKEFTVKVLAFEFITPMAIEIHRGRLHTVGKIKQLVATLDKVTGAVVGKAKPRIIKPGQVARLVIELYAAVPLEAPSKVILRNSGETIGAGLLE